MVPTRGACSLLGLSLTFALGASAYSGDSPAGPSGPAPPSGAITEAPTTLPPRTALENAIKDHYAGRFNEPVFRPAIVNDPSYVNCSGQGFFPALGCERRGVRNPLPVHRQSVVAAHPAGLDGRAQQ